jgi:hypothetical protein
MANYVEKMEMHQARRGTDIFGRPLPETHSGMMELRKQQTAQERQDLQNAATRRPITGTMTLSNAKGQDVSVMTVTDPITGRVTGVLPNGKRVLISQGTSGTANRIGQTIQRTGTEPVMQNELETYDPSMLPENVRSNTPPTAYKPTMFEDGSSVVFDNAGNRRYLKPDGSEVTDLQEIDKLVKEGIRSGVLSERDRAFAEGQGRIQANVLGDFQQRIEPVNRSIRLMRSAVELLDSGANTGPIANLFPSMTADTLKLESLQQQLGLSTIQTTTFGALSAPELKLALEAEFPTSLDEKDMKQYLLEKIAAQEKLKAYIIEVMTFMNAGPGNTLAKFYTEKRKQMDRAKAGGTGQTFTGPDNTFVIEIDG